MDEFKEYKLNKEQTEAVNAPLQGAKKIIAGAGTGKTKVLAERIKYIITNHNIDSNRILVSTFTNKATEKLRLDVTTIFPKKRFDWILTFHAFCFNFLQRMNLFAKNGRDTSIIDDIQKRDILALICTTNDTKHNEKLIENMIKIISFRKTKQLEVAKAINETFNDPEYSTHHPKYVEMANVVFTSYESYLQINNFVDYDDLLVKTRDALSGNEEIRKKWQDYFEYVLVDEFQDVNTVQYEIIWLIAQNQHKIFVVGDPEQEIYSWRGTMANIWDRFESDFPETKEKKFVLNQNYRSSESILKVANDLLVNNDSTKKHEKLISTRPEGKKVIYYDAPSPKNETKWVVNKIKEIIRNEDNIHFGDIAILFRTRSFSQRFQKALEANKLPFCFYHPTLLIKEKSIVNCLRILRSAIFKDDASICALLLANKSISTEDLLKIKNAANKFHSSIYVLLSKLHKNNVVKSKEKIEKITHLFSELDKLEKMVESKIISVIDDTRKVFNALKDFIGNKNDKNAQRQPDSSVFFKLIQNFAVENPDGSLKKFLSKFPLLDYSQWDLDNKIKLMTIHSVKGLEFSYVFVVGLLDGILPIWHAISGKHNENIKCAITKLNEEHRLFYVAVTRAKNQLFLTSCRNQKANSEAKKALNIKHYKRSRFLKEINTEHYETPDE